MKPIEALILKPDLKPFGTHTGSQNLLAGSSSFIGGSEEIDSLASALPNPSVRPGQLISRLSLDSIIPIEEWYKLMSGSGICQWPLSDTKNDS